MTDTGTQSVKLIGWLERKSDDFPFYNGRPVTISAGNWWLVMAAVAIAYIALIYLLGVFPTGILGFLPAILFCAIPLAALAYVAGNAWKALFRRLRAVDFVWMVVFYILNFIVTLIVGMIVITFFETDTNPAGAIIAEASQLEKVLFFFKAAIQLLGEEIFTILPFLAILTWLVSSRGMSRTVAIALSALAVGVIFAAIHLPTYQWHFGQAMVGLVPVRITLLLAYIVTKNIWVSTGAHVINDWVAFGLPMLAANGGE